MLAPLVLAGEVATCSVIEPEVLYSARSHEDFDFVAAITGQPMRWVVPRGSIP